MAASSREKAPSLLRRGPSYLFRMEFTDQGEKVRASWKVGSINAPIALAERTAKIVRAKVRELVAGGRSELQIRKEVDALLKSRLDEQDGPTAGTVNELADELFRLEDHDNPKAAHEGRSIYTLHIAKPIGRFAPLAITPALLREKVFEAMAERKLSQATLNNARIVARKVFRYAVHKQLIQRNPVDDIYRMPRAKKDNRPYVLPSDDELVMLIRYLYSRDPTENVGGGRCARTGHPGRGIEIHRRAKDQRPSRLALE